MRIKLSNSVPAIDLVRQTPGRTGVWGEHEFLINQPASEVDAWAVIDGLPTADSATLPSGNLLFFASEAPAYKTYQTGWMAAFAHVISSTEKTNHPSVVVAPPPLIWLIGKDYSELGESHPSETKTHLLSGICSRKTTLAGHRRRLAFLQRLHDQYPFDLYGRGFHELADKWEGLAPYRYSIAMENSIHPHYWTEKIADCFLAETVPIYSGSSNIADYFPKDAYVPLELDATPRQIESLRATLSPEDYQRRLPALKEAKRLCLDYYNAIPTVARFAVKWKSSSPVTKVTLQPEPPLSYWQKKAVKFWRKLPWSR